MRLHKLPNGYVLTSDEVIKDVRPYIGKLHLEKGTILNTFPSYLTDLSECKLVITQDFDFSSLSPEEQKEIGWFDVENELNKLLDKDENLYSMVELMSYKLGFQKAQELLSDRMFTLEDMRNAFDRGEWDGCGKSNTVRNTIFDDFIQSLSQPKSWEVEVEMETLYLEEDSMNYTHEQDDVSGSKEFPKLTKGKAKVLRIIK